MKRFSIYVLFGLLFTIAFVIFEREFNRAQWTQAYREVYAGNADRLPDEAFVVRTYFETNKNLDMIEKILEHRRERVRTVDFWILFHEKKLYKYGVENARPESFDIKLDGAQPGQVFQHEQFSYTVMDIGDGFTLVLGLRYLPDAYMNYRYRKLMGTIVINHVLALAIALAIFAYLFRDIRRSLSNLLRRNTRTFGKLTANSREAELLARGLSAYEEQAEQLVRERDLLSWQVLPSLRTELSSGKKPPYEFDCTLVRTDINGFSTIFNEHPVEQFAATINEFFTDVSHIVARYGGLVHEFVGDEVIFYFKDEDARLADGTPVSSVALAISALKDINLAAERYHQVTMRDRGYPFTVKSSLAHGRLRFGRLVNGHGLSGAILIETVRILSHINEKNENTVLFADRHVSQAQLVAVTETDKRVRLKGFREETGLCTYREHLELERFLDSDEASSLARAACFRGDDDLLKIVRWARAQTRAGQFGSAGRALGLLRNFHLTKTDGRAQTELLDWVGELVQEARIGKSDQPRPASKTLASALRVIENIVPKDKFDSRIEKLVDLATELADRRVVANALDVLTYFKNTGEAEDFGHGDLTRHRDNRVAANALVFQGRQALGSGLVRRIRRMLDSKENVRVASALYAIGELAAHHQATDKIYYRTQIEFLDLVNRISSFTSHSDPMIQRQASVALKKASLEASLNSESKRAA
jgi:adenylate cyclase